MVEKTFAKISLVPNFSCWNFVKKSLGPPRGLGKGANCLAPGSQCIGGLKVLGPHEAMNSVLKWNQLTGTEFCLKIEECFKRLQEA